MNFQPVHPRETILQALEQLGRMMTNQYEDPDTRFEIIDIIDKAKQWAHRATTPEERASSVNDKMVNLPPTKSKL